MRLRSDIMKILEQASKAYYEGNPIMTDAQFDRTTVKINLSNTDEQFLAKGEVITFEGFMKVYLEGKSHAEASEELGLPLGTVKSRVRLALQKMQILVAPEFRDELL